MLLCIRFSALMTTFYNIIIVAVDIQTHITELNYDFIYIPKPFAISTKGKKLGTREFIPSLKALASYEWSLTETENCSADLVNAFLAKYLSSHLPHIS